MKKINKYASVFKFSSTMRLKEFKSNLFSYCNNFYSCSTAKDRPWLWERGATTPTDFSYFIFYIYFNIIFIYCYIYIYIYILSISYLEDYFNYLNLFHI